METGVFIICLDILTNKQKKKKRSPALMTFSSSSFMEDAIYAVLSIPARPPAYWELLVCTFACARTHINVRMFAWTVEVHGCESRAR